MVDNNAREELTDELVKPRRKADGFGAEPTEAVAFGARLKKFALPGVLLASITAGLVFGGLTPERPGNDKALTAVPAAQSEVAPAQARTEEQVSRNQERPEIEAESVDEELPVPATAQLGSLQVESASPTPSASPSRSAEAKGTRYATEDVNIRAKASASSDKIGEVKRGESVSITGKSDKGFTEITQSGRAGWISTEFLSASAPSASAPSESATAKASKTASKAETTKADEKKTTAPAKTTTKAAAPKAPTAQAPKSEAPAATGSSSCPRLPGVTANTEKVHQAVCAKYGSGVSSYLGVRPDSDVEHPSGRAVDIMITNNSTGWAIANYVRANAGSFGVTEVIFDQKIWTTQRASEGWRSMSDRGSVTANHRDHVHVSTR